ncbi:beta-lactam antibiotic acylase family protein [Pedobacter sp. BAL39]|uniref:penicillin acylase family protein n=1 Tax=Pedobacter sp. BAL39 TaxID=391596 RepID=UPI000155A0A2|nr:penicillin acylase family protein [Pedobacter sp. BAL39]EDM38775.1 beta-lactam antibiotic acylase family protein [Pedobacter sp. BAL39]
MNKIKAFICLLIPILLAYAGNTKFGDLPPIVKFLNPFTGFWQNAERNTIKAKKSLVLKGTKEKVSIAFDDRMIPHIFAKNDHDLYFAQGYVTAMHRLWQMDFQTRYAAGRLSEVVGKKAIEVDRYQRRMGMVYGAEQSLKGMMADPKSREMILAYTAGINAYIHRLSPAKLPVEYKLLDFTPEDWTPIKCALLLKQMSAVLAMGSDEFYMSNIRKKFGTAVVKDLFPDYPFKEDPIIPIGTSWDFKPLAIPEAPVIVEKPGIADVSTKQKEDGIGSNNWALSGAKTRSGYPILANDPHLDLSLPSIWYQIQLHAPGVNAYGVSLPGAPGIIIGFNNDIAWGVTNVAADVLDFYQIKFKDDSHQNYWYNNKWNKTRSRVEKIKIRGTSTELDTVFYTHHGPVVYLEKPEKYTAANNIPTGSALRWIAHEQSNELKTFYLLNRSHNYADYRKALISYTAPAQNFVFASKDNDIAITANGKFPLKWKDQGKFVLDGADPKNDWRGWIPAEQNPTVKNPSRNFVSSANQSSTDPSYPYYINWEFSAYDRGKRINDRLSVMTKATADSIRLMQSDSYSIFAQNILPTISSMIDINGLNATQKEAFRITSEWNKFYEATALGATIFELWAKRLTDNIWKDEFDVAGIPMRYPSRDRTVQLILHEQQSKWIDNIKTPVKESLSDLVNEAFKYTCDSLERKYGAIGKSWAWANVKNTNIRHLARIPGLGSNTLMIGGGKMTINALGEHNGPSWRMVVELGKKPKGHGVYPGGQSGNPGSRFYDNMIDTWANGQLYDLYFMQSADDASAKIISQLTISKK